MPVPRIPCFLIWEKSLVVLCGFRDKFDDRIFGARLVFLPCGTSTERRGKSLDSGRSGILCPYWTVVKNVLSSRGTRRKRVIFRERSAGESKSTCGCASCVYVRVWVRCYMLKTCRVKLTRDCNDINPVPVSFRGRSRSVVRAFLRRFPISPNALDVGETRSAREQTAPAKRTARSKAPCCLLLHSRCVVICPLYYNAGPLFFFISTRIPARRISEISTTTRAFPLFITTGLPPPPVPHRESCFSFDSRVKTRRGKIQLTISHEYLTRLVLTVHEMIPWPCGPRLRHVTAENRSFPPVVALFFSFLFLLLLGHELHHTLVVYFEKPTPLCNRVRMSAPIRIRIRIWIVLFLLNRNEWTFLVIPNAVSTLYRAGKSVHFWSGARGWEGHVTNSIPRRSHVKPRISIGETLRNAPVGCKILLEKSVPVPVCVERLMRREMTFGVDVMRQKDEWIE